MKMIGCDFHPSWQQVAIFDSSTGEILEHKLVNGNGEAERFYGSLPRPSLIGLESCGNSEWFVELVEQLGHQIWIGDAAEIRASYVRKQKTDQRDTAHFLKLLMEGRFPRLWTPSAGQIDEVRRAADAQAKVEPVFAVEIKDRGGEVVAVVERVVHVRKK